MQFFYEALEEAGVPAGPINTVEDVFNDPQIREQIREHGMDAIPSSPRELGEKIEREYVLWERVIKQAGITAD
jgi:crotonobetainyl-CoA:carnitine CoA-transferase CaiB-like acyl-CoA transferase